MSQVIEVFLLTGGGFIAIFDTEEGAKFGAKSIAVKENKRYKARIEKYKVNQGEDIFYKEITNEQ